MKLYKYVCPGRINILTNGTIRFTQPLAWNDPFELRPFYKDDKAKEPIVQFAKFTKIMRHFEQTGEVLVKEIEEFEKERKRVTKDDIYRFINDNVVGLSLTEDKENLLMWSHYAKEHSGFVIELDTEDDFFKSKDKFLFKVEYDIIRPQIDTDAFSMLMINVLQSLKDKVVLDKGQLEKIS